MCVDVNLCLQGVAIRLSVTGDAGRSQPLNEYTYSLVYVVKSQLA